MHIEAFKEVLAWAVVKYFWFSNDILLIKIVILLNYSRINLKIILYTLLCGP